MRSTVLFTPVWSYTLCSPMAHRIFVSHLGQGEATLPYGYSTATKNKACQLVKKKKRKKEKRNLSKQSQPLRPKTCTQAHLRNHLVAPNVPEVSFWRRNTSSIIHNLQSAPKIARTESGFPERGKQQNISSWNLPYCSKPTPKCKWHFSQQR